MTIKLWRWTFAAGLMAALLGSGTGCQPASSTGAPPRNTPQPDKKEKPAKPPKPDIGE